MTEHIYSLHSVLPILQKGRRSIFFIALGAMVLSLLVYLIWPPKYKARVEFFLKNPMYADRGNLYSSDAKMIDYFASDEDIDRMKSLVWTDVVQDRMIAELQLDKAYGYDRSDPEDVKELKKSFSKRVHIYRTESRVVVLSYLDGNEARAALAANRCVVLLEQQLQGFYNGMRSSIYNTLQGKIQEEDSAIAALSDTLSVLRERYRIYDIISPTRNNIMLSAVHDNGAPGFAHGVELIQNIESIKDQLVSDRSRHISLASQYDTRTNELPITQILKREQPPFKREGPPLPIIVVGCGLAGAFFGVLYVLAGYRVHRSRVKTSSAYAAGQHI
jgi:uncharacterized protein involved in exopolysaccharide biosynthesis